MIINANVVISLDTLGISCDNFEILKDVATNSEWDTVGYNKIIFYAEYTDNFRDIEKDIENIKIMASFKEVV